MESVSDVVENFLLVGNQVVVLFILMSLGAIGNRKRLLSDESIRGITNVVLYFVTPCVVINAFQRVKEPGLINGLLVTAGIALAVHVISIALAMLIIHDKDKDKETVFRFGAIFANCGFMSLPIQEAVLGDIGVFYGSVYIAVFNVVLWTYGLATMSGDIKSIKPKDLILNPGILGTVIGLVIFLCEIKLPTVVASPISYMALLNTPVPMIVIGYYLGNLKPIHLRTNLKQYLSIALRLVGIPLVTIGLMLLLRPDKTIFIVCTIAGCAPSAAVTAMFATRFSKDAQLGAQMVSVATLFSLITIPTLVSLANYLS